MSKNLVIVGAGPVGLFTVFQAGMLGMKCVVIDTLTEVGGQCTALYPEKPIYDIPGFPEVMACDLVIRLEQQAAPFEPTYMLGESVIAIEEDTDSDEENPGFLLRTSADNEVEAGAVIIASGRGSFTPNIPNIEGIEEYLNKSVFTSVKDKEQFRNQDILIAGGGDSAVDWAILLSEIANSVKIIHRRDKFRAMEESISKLHALNDAGKLEILIPYQLDNIYGDGAKINTADIVDLDGNIKKLQLDTLMLFFGLKMDFTLISKWGLEVNKRSIPVDIATMETSRKGVFAIGDIAEYENKLKLILSGFAESATACYSAYGYMNAGSFIKFQHSTSKGIPTKPVQGDKC